MRTPALGFALLLVAAAVVPASALAADVAAPGSAAAAPPSEVDGSTAGADAAEALAEQPVFPQADDGASPRTTIEISLRSDRSAYWRVETHYSLDSENETRAFRTLASQYEAGEADAGPDATLFESLQQRASESTGRTMTVENVTYHSTIDETEGRGTLALTFRWTNFLRQGDNETLILDDTFRLPTAESDERRTWLSIFDGDQEILIRPPDGYTVTGTSIPVQQRQSAVVFAEPSDFEGDRELRITYTTVGPADQLPIGYFASGGLVAVVALLTGAWWFRWRDDPDSAGSGPTDPGDPRGPAASPGADAGASRDGVAGASGDAAGTAPGDAEANGTGGRAGGPTGVAADADGGADAADAKADVDLSLLSDEERVEHLLSRNGGRMKQATIVDETGWSDAKVSQLLSAMADDGRVDKLRLGRENLISLPEDPEGGASDPAGDGTEVGNGRE